VDDASDPDPPVDQGATSTCSRAAGCLVIGILLVALGAFGARRLQSSAGPTLVEDQGRASLVFEGLGSINLMPGPGCSALTLEPSWDSFKASDLAWLADGRPCQARVRLFKRFQAGQPAGWNARIGDQSLEFGQTLVLLPGGQTVPLDADPSSGPLLDIERWEGPLANGSSCVVWVYRPLEEGGANRYCHFMDGHDLGYSTGSSQSAGANWNVGEEYEGGTRDLVIEDGVGTYVLRVAGKSQEVTLQRTSKASWPAPDHAK
jgi:hypothetical protein